MGWDHTWGLAGRGMVCLLLVGPVYGGSAACFPAYEPGTLLVDDAHARRVGCLDVRVGLIQDAAAEPHWVVVGLDVGNGCDAPVVVDLRHVRVEGRFAGRRVPMRPFDPRAEIDGGVLDGRAEAREVIAYVPPAGVVQQPREVCVDVGGITRAEPTAPVCLRTQADAAGEEP